MANKSLPILLAFLVSATLARAEYFPWPEDAVDAFKRIPIQHDGRTKPMSTVAHWTLLELHGKTTLSTLSKEEAREYGKGEMPSGREGIPRKLSATEWLMDVLFRPEIAKLYPVFLVDDSSAVTAIDVDAKKMKRTTYSYLELLPGRAKLAELATSFAQKQAREEKLTALEEQIVLLGRRVNQFEFLASAFGPAHPSELVNPDIIDPDMREILGSVKITELIERTPPLSMQQIAAQFQRDPSLMSEDERTFLAAMKSLFFLSRSANALTPFPAQDLDDKDWVSAGSLVESALEAEKEEREWAMTRLAKFEDLAAASENPDEFAAELRSFGSFISADAEAHGERLYIEEEILLYERNLIPSAKVLFVLGCVLMFISWLNPPSFFGKITATIGLWTGFAASFNLIWGMILRSQIRGWAPVTNLYETFLFIAMAGFIFGVLFEFFNPRRNRVAISVGLFLPAICLFLAGQFERLDPSDTLPPLVAVLRSNFWLSTHVITITLGYAGGLVAALVSHFWIIGKAFRIKPEDQKGYRNISKMAYGIILFSLIFSLIGTVLGGIWANYSWGRFWGWDPKENGALMIVLWTLLILHARLGGYIKELGLHVLSILLGCIIGFSWFGTNALGVGLHSYGFAAGIWQALLTYWGIEAAVLLLALWIKIREKVERGGSSGGRPQPSAA